MFGCINCVSECVCVSVCADCGHAPYLCEASLKGWEFALPAGFVQFFLSVLFYEQ